MLGDSPYVKHRPAGEYDPARLQHTYAVGRVKGSDWPIVEVWTTERLLKHRNRYNKVGKRHYSFENWEMYARKVPLLQVIKYLPSSPELEAAVMMSDAHEMGMSQGMTIDAAISNTYAPPGVDSDLGTKDESDKGASNNKSGADLAGGFTYAQVRELIDKSIAAKDLPKLADAQALVGSLPKEFHVELNALANKGRADIDAAEAASRG